MGVLDANRFRNESKTDQTVSHSGRFVRPGRWSLLALLLSLLFFGIWAVTWAGNERIIAWLLSQGIVEESATRTLPGTLRSTSLAIAGLGMVSTLPVVTWCVLATYRLGPVQTLASHLANALSAMVSPLRVVANSGAQATSMALGHLELAVSTFFRHVSSGASLALGYMSFGIGVVTKALAPLLTRFWIGVAAVARFVALVVGHLWLGASIAFGYVRRAGARAMRDTWAGVAAVARFVALVLGHVWLGVSMAFGYVRRAGARAMRDTWSGVATVARLVALVLGHLWLGASIAFGYMRRAVARAMRCTWAGASAVARFVALVLGHVWLGVSIAFGYMRRAFD